ncbi:MAG: caspase family protein [Alphaproteobacteria bacterium]
MLRIRSVVVALAVAGTLALPATARAGITVEVSSGDATAAATEQVELYGASHALVVGNDAYSAGWPRLRNAVADAERVAEGLRRQGFEVTFLTDLDAEGMRKAFKEFFVLKGADPEARLLLWYAGHGQSQGGEGFLVPTDAPAPSDPTFALYALPMRDMGTLVRLAKAKHVLAIFDSCFAGTIFDARAGAPPPAITRATLLPVRQFVSSGDADQTVADNGSFRELFLRAVAGEERADANGDGYLTGSELGAFLADRVTNLTGGAQTPRFGKLLDVNFDRGDFVFVLPNRTATTGTAEAVTTEPAATTAALEPEAPIGEPTPAEETAWLALAEAGDPVALRGFVAQFPAGAYRGIADQRLEVSAAAAQTAAEPVPSVQPCDKYAAHPEDPNRAGRGIGWDGINPKKAIPACQEAMAAYPDALRFAYQLGRAYAKDEQYDQAIAVLEAATDYSAAVDLLAWLHQTGRGVEADNAKASELYRQAANAGYGPSQYELGVALETGRGVDQDPFEAAAWYRAAAAQGVARAQLRMADTLNAGLLGETNPLEALVWYDIALERLPADERQGGVERRKELVESMPPEDVALAQRLASEWRPASNVVPVLE